MTPTRPTLLSPKQGGVGISHYCPVRVKVQSCHLVSMIPEAPLTTHWGWKFWLPTQPLLLLMMVGLQVFLWYLTGVELLLSKSSFCCFVFFVFCFLLDFSFLCPLTSEYKCLRRFFFFFLLLSALPGCWVAGFSSTYPGIYMAVREPREFNTTHGSWGPLPGCLFLSTFQGLLLFALYVTFRIISCNHREETEK